MEICFCRVRVLRAISIILAQDRVFYVLANKFNNVAMYLLKSNVKKTTGISVRFQIQISGNVRKNKMW